MGETATEQRVTGNLDSIRETVFSHIPPPPPYTPRDPSTINTISEVVDQPIIQQTIIVQPPLKNGPVYYRCPACNENVVTKVQYSNSKNTHMMAGFICGLTFWCLLCCFAAIPYVLPTFKEVVHYCPNCETCLGSYSKL